MTTLTKDSIVRAIAKKFDSPDFNIDRSREVVERLLEIIKRTLENGDEVLISGFGKFCVMEKRERKGRNPATGEDLMIAPRNVVTFKCSGTFRETLNQEAGGREKFT